VDEFHNLCILVLTFPTYVTGVNVKVDTEALKTEVPHIVVGTPGRVLDLATKRNVMDLSKVPTVWYVLLCASTFPCEFCVVRPHGPVLVRSLTIVGGVLLYPLLVC
jgi:hypothetical protein